MRTYGKRFLRQIRDRQIRNTRETKNAIVWSLDEANRKANVRIHGSNSTVSAYFPVSWHVRPDWCKLGAPVRILFSGGHRGRIELLGPGVVIPYPQTGQVWPDPPVKANQILEGLEVIPIPNRKKLAVMVLTGKALINNVEVVVDSILLGDGNWILGDGGYLGEVAAVLNVLGIGSVAYPSTAYKIIKVFLKADGEIYLEEGVPFEAASPNWNILGRLESVPYTIPKTYYDFTNYVFPDELSPPEPSSELELGSIVIWEDCTEIHTTNINWQWRETKHRVYSRDPIYLLDETTGAQADHILDWGETHMNLMIYAYSNVNNWFNVNSVYNLRATIIQGNGTVTDGLYPGLYDTTIICMNLYDPWSHIYYPVWWVRYKRDGLVTDESPTIELKLLVDNEVIAYTNVTLLDAAGDPMH